MLSFRLLIEMNDITIVRDGSKPIIQHLSWVVRPGEFWGITGPSGTGKTTLAEAIAGKHRIVSGQWRTTAQRIRLVSFRENSRRFSHANHYYQQRFNFIEPEDDLSVHGYLFPNNQSIHPTARKWLEWLLVEPLLNQSMIQLSNGQLRRTRIVKALLDEPDLLILDDPFMGIDAEGRQELHQVLKLIADRGTNLILISKAEQLPDWITHHLQLNFDATYQIQKHRPDSEQKLTPRLEYAYHSTEPAIIELKKISVQYGSKKILDQIDWTIRRGDRWALVGPNGSGKSTLLSLIFGDHPQAYSNEVVLFGNRRGQGESIWEIKAKIGFLSPELHLYFSEPLNAIDVAATGFFDILVKRPTNAKQTQIVKDYFDRFQITELANRPFRSLSTGQQRLALFIRSIVKRPELLILDEPFQGMDEQQIGQIQTWFADSFAPDQSLIFVTHYPGEIPPMVNQILRLDAGKIT